MLSLAHDLDCHCDAVEEFNQIHLLGAAFSVVRKRHMADCVLIEHNWRIYTRTDAQPDHNYDPAPIEMHQ
jgi:hypothetical protein